MAWGGAWAPIWNEKIAQYVKEVGVSKGETKVDELTKRVRELTSENYHLRQVIGDAARHLTAEAARQARRDLDACMNCKGSRGGVPGNENIIDGKILCDYCTVEVLEKRRKT